MVDARTGQVYNTAAQEIQVTTPPPWYVRYLWLIILILFLLLAAIAAALIARKVSRDRKNVRGLAVTLLRGGAQGRELEAPDTSYAEVFPFIIRDPDTSPRLDYPPAGMNAGICHLRRAGRGLVRLTTPMGLRPYEVELGGPAQEIEDGFEVAVRDTLHPSRRASGSRRKNRDGGPGGPAVPAPAGGAPVPGGYTPSTGYPGGTTAPGGGYTPTSRVRAHAGYPPAPSSPGTSARAIAGQRPCQHDPGSQPTMPSAPPPTYEPPKNPWL